MTASITDIRAGLTGVTLSVTIAGLFIYANEALRLDIGRLHSHLSLRAQPYCCTKSFHPTRKSPPQQASILFRSRMLKYAFFGSASRGAHSAACLLLLLLGITESALLVIFTLFIARNNPKLHNFQNAIIDPIGIRWIVAITLMGGCLLILAYIQMWMMQASRAYGKRRRGDDFELGDVWHDQSQARQSQKQEKQLENLQKQSNGQQGPGSHFPGQQSQGEQDQDE
jgi:TRAP-type C4-dicarboxylate transport system permease small subunit